MKLAYQAALDGGKGLKKLQAIARKNLLTGMSQLMAYVQFITGGDTAKIISSGMGIKQSRTPAILPEMVINLKAFTGDVIGTAKMLWKAHDKVKYYEIQYTTTDPGSGWTHLGVSSKSRYTAEALPANVQIWIRVAAINSAGQGGFSEPVQVFIKG
ncbi:MAG: hypothetical protein RL708_2559 [Bacteroidota bacterium]|jgi:hypothetical protein